MAEGLLPSKESRAKFIESFPAVTETEANVSLWLWSWFNDFDFADRGAHIETAIKNLGWNRYELRVCIKGDDIDDLFAHGIGYKHGAMILEDLKSAYKQEVRKLDLLPLTRR